MFDVGDTIPKSEKYVADLLGSLAVSNTSPLTNTPSMEILITK